MTANVPVLGPASCSSARPSRASRPPRAASSRSRRTRSSARTPTRAADPNYNAIVFAGDHNYGASDGFHAGSTFKLFTLIDWLEKGHSRQRDRQRQGPQDHEDQGQLHSRGYWIDPGADCDQELRRRRRLRRHADAVHRGLAQLRIPGDGGEARPLRHPEGRDEDGRRRRPERRARRR